MGTAVPTVFSVLPNISMSGSGKDVLGVVGIIWDEVRAGTFPDITPSLRDFASKCTVVATVGGG